MDAPIRHERGFEVSCQVGELGVEVWGASLHAERGFGVRHPPKRGRGQGFGVGWFVSLDARGQQEERPIRQILYLGELLETCHFQSFWVSPRSPVGSLALQGWRR